jgi:cytochrome c oxidase subunit II
MPAGGFAGYPSGFKGRRMKPALLVVIGLVVGAIAAVGVIAAPILPEQASEQAEGVDWLWFYMVAISGPLFGVVTVVLLYCVVRFRGRPGDMSDGPPIHGITWLEALWTIIPVIMVVSIVAFSWVILNENDDTQAADRLNVHVMSYQFGWDYAYTDEDIGIERTDELVLPVGQPVRFEIETRDVIHSWWVPDWRLQMNATPGQVNLLSVTPRHTGEHELVCAFLCGVGHAAMNSEVGETSLIKRVRVVEQAEFDAWVAEQRAAQEEAAAAPGAEGVAVFQENGCGGCHALAAANAGGQVGPSLETSSLQEHADAAGQPLEDYIRQSVVDPGAYVAPDANPGMPDNFDALEGEPLDQLVSLLAGAGGAQ